MQIEQKGLPCSDLDVAQKFYCETLGLTLADEIPGMAKLFGCEGVNLIVFKGETVAPNSVIYFKIDGVAGKIAEKVEQLKAAGVKIEQEAKCIAPNWHGKDVYLAFFRVRLGTCLG